MTKEKRIYDRNNCPLLVDNECSIYASRPTFCRSAFSYSKNACREADVDSTISVPMERGSKTMADDIMVAVLLGERSAEYNLNIVKGLANEFKW